MMLSVFPPDTIVAPVGIVQVYDVALAIGVTEYSNPLLPWHTAE
jgi:hypothetical protein